MDASRRRLPDGLSEAAETRTEPRALCPRPRRDWGLRAREQERDDQRSQVIAGVPQ